MINSAKIDQSLAQPAQSSIKSVSGHETEILTQIYDTQVDLCILKRQIDAEVKEYVRLLQQSHGDFRMTRIITLDDLSDVLLESLPLHKWRNRFVDDILVLTDMFSCLFELKQVGFRLCVLNKSMCPRFHTDKVPCRLITTYTGKGTEWLDWRIDDLSILDACNSEHLHPDFIYRLDEGDIALLKGDKWPEKDSLGVIHRSPALSGNEKRLLLTLDFAH
ncbi:MAG: DUF1826 domain-containing protein [Nitrosomonas sp.]